MFDVSREMGSSVALYSRKVLIQTKATDILPKWLRFLRGVDPIHVSESLLSFYTHRFKKNMVFFYNKTNPDLNVVCVQVWWIVRTSP